MSVLNQILQFIALLKGAFDGDQVHQRSFHIWHHRFMCFLYAFESIKHGYMAFSTNPQLYMYLGDVRFSANKLQKLSSPIVFLFAFMWFIVYIRSDIYSQQPWRLQFLNPILWPASYHHNQVNIDSTETRVEKHRYNRSKLFIFLVTRLPSYCVIINFGLFLVCAGLTFRGTYDGYLYLSSRIFWLVSVPCSLSTTLLMMVMSTCCFFFTMVAFFVLLYLFQQVSDERDTQKWIRWLVVQSEHDSRFRAYILHQKRILVSLKRLDQLLKERKQFAFFVDHSFIFHFITLLVICILLPYMVLFENPLIYSLALASINVFTMLILILPVCLCNSLLHTRVSSPQ